MTVSQIHDPATAVIEAAHIDSDQSLEFWGEEFAEDGLPIWERPI